MNQPATRPPICLSSVPVEPAPAPDSSDEGGFVLPTFGLILIALMAMAGFGLDVWNWWYTGQQVQRAADAAALSGVVFMPDDFAAANTTALAAATQNGFSSGVSVTGTSKSNQLQVTVTRTVNNRFTQLLGVPTTTVTRKTVAEFTGRVSMGSPDNTAGQDPDNNKVVDFWLSDSGRGTTKQGGDRYQSGSCAQTSFLCPSGNPEPSNPEYDQNGYTFTVRVNGGSVGGPLTIDIFDPAQIPHQFQDCGEAQISSSNGDSKIPRNFVMANVNSDWGTIAGVANNDRYDDPLNAPSKKFCVGDVENQDESAADLAALAPSTFNPVNADNQTSTFVIRGPDNTPNSDLDNPILTGASCRPKQFAPWASPSGKSWYNYLDLGDGWRDNSGAVSASNNRGNRRTVVNGVYTNLAEASAFHNEFRTWVNVCTIPQATANTLLASGTDFIVQVLSNVPYQASTTLTDPLPRTDIKDGRNHFSIRANALSTNVDVFANGRLPMAAASRGANTTFYLAKLGPENAGRTLSVEFFDVGDAVATGTITINKGTGSGGSPFTCSFTRIDQFDANNPPTSSGCQLQNVNSASGYQGSKTTASVAIPSDYTCVTTDLSCWVTIVFAYPLSGGEVLDHTVWSAGLIGDPVRIIE